jgi:hypothetical protein
MRWDAMEGEGMGGIISTFLIVITQLQLLQCYYYYYYYYYSGLSTEPVQKDGFFIEDQDGLAMDVRVSWVGEVRSFASAWLAVACGSVLWFSCTWVCEEPGMLDYLLEQVYPCRCRIEACCFDDALCMY